MRTNVRYVCTHNSRDSSVGIATGYGLDSREVVVGVPVGYIAQSGSGVHPDSYPRDTGGSFYGG
jgi:hypothetical protein